MCGCLFTHDMAAALTVDVPRVDAALRPIVAAVLADLRADSLPVSEEVEDDEGTHIAIHMLEGLVSYALRSALLEEVNGANIAFGEEPQIACLHGRHAKLRVKAKLGEGANGRVFAVDAKSAVKVTHLGYNYGAAASLRKGFDEEVAMARKASQLGVGPKVLDAFVCAERHRQHHGIMLMSRVEGKGLNEWIDGASVAQVAALRVALEGILVRMHANGIFHNDMKPGNVMVTKKGVPVIVDFGNASSTPDRTYNDRSDKHDDFSVLKYVLKDRGGRAGRWQPRADSIDTLVKHIVRRACAAGVIAFTVGPRLNGTPRRPLR